MKRLLLLFVLGMLFVASEFSSEAYADEAITSRSVEIHGAKLHYFTAGHGPTLILLHGYAETSLMWKPIMPALAGRFTVIAPDLPGIGGSDIPADGLDMQSAAVRMHDLSKSLGVQNAEVVGHDIGLMVAYAYAAQFPAEVTKLVLMDAFLPGVEGWEAVLQQPGDLAFSLQWTYARGACEGSRTHLL
jgi:pimeloyl-ACP methyl ester carboxylesterase